jgi:prophage antirepressor-like protein
MKNQLIPFSFEEKNIRIVVVDGEPWFVAKDVASALEYPESSSPARLFAHVPDEWKGVNPIHTLGGIQRMLCLSEQGLYFFLGRSDKPKAVPFQKKVAGDVLPQIRRTGKYDGLGKATEAFLIIQYLEEENKSLRREIRRYETRNFLTAGDKIDIVTLRVQEYPVSAIQKITKKGRKRIKDFLDRFFSLSEEEWDAELESWYKAVEGKGEKLNDKG